MKRKIALFLSLLLIFTGTSPQAYAQEDARRVSTLSELILAISKAEDGDKIILTQTIDITSSVNIGSSEANITITGEPDSVGTLFNISTNEPIYITLDNITFTATEVNATGVVILDAPSGSIICSNVTWYGSVGSSLYIQSGSAVLNSCVFMYGRTLTDGSAVYVNKGCSCVAYDSKFSNNHSQNGGAVYTKGDFRAVRCNFDGNGAVKNGGAVYGTTFVAENTRIYGNSANYGGGVYITESATLSECVILQNNGNAAGKDLYAEGTLDLQVEDYNSLYADYLPEGIYNHCAWYLDTEENPYNWENPSDPIDTSAQLSNIALAFGRSYKEPEPEPTPDPEVAPTPDPTPEPDQEPPETEQEPEPEPEVTPTPEPETPSEPEDEVEPAPTPAPDTGTEPEPEQPETPSEPDNPIDPDPEPEPDPTPTPEPEDEIDPDPEITPDQPSDPTPEPEVDPEIPVDPEPDIPTEPEVEDTPDPEPDPEPEQIPDTPTEQEPETPPETTPDLEPDNEPDIISPIPEPVPTPEPEVIIHYVYVPVRETTEKEEKTTENAPAPSTLVLRCGVAEIDNTAVKPLLSGLKRFVPATKKLTRGEAAALLYGLLTVESQAAFATSSSYSDMSGSPYETAVAALSNAGIFSGSTDGAYRPDDPISFAELLTVLTHFVEPKTAYAGSFAGHWAEQAATTAFAHGWIDDLPLNLDAAVTYGLFVNLITTIYEV